MAYVFNPTTNTLIDDEDKSLGNKFAVLDSDLEAAIQSLNEKFGPGTVQEGTQGIPQPPIKTPQAIFEFEERMKGRMAEGGDVRQNFVAAGLAVPFAPALSYPASFGLAKIFGLTTAGLGAKELGDSVTNYIKENPQVLDTPQAKAAMMTFGIVPENIKDTFFSKDKGDDKKDIIPSDDKPPNIKPPKIPESLEIAENVLTLKEIRDTFKKSKKLYDEKKMSEVVKVTDENFAQNLANFIDTNYGGRIEPAVKDILGVKEKTKEVENLRRRVRDLFINRGIERGARTGNIAPSNLDFETDTPKISWSDFTTTVSQDSSYIKKLTKPLIKQNLISKDQYLPQTDFEKIFGIEHTGTKEQIRVKRSNMGYMIKKLADDGSIRKKPGKFPQYHVGDLLKAFQLKYGDGGKKIYGVVKKGTPQKYEKLRSFDKELASVIDGFQTSFEQAAKTENLTEKKSTGKEGIINKASPDHSHAEARSTMLKFPNVFKNSNLKTFQTITLADPIFNQEIINKGGFESKKIKIYRILNNHIGKKVTPEIQNILTEQKTKLNNINNEILVAAEKAGLEGVQETFIPIDINVPNVGEKFKSENVFGDTTGKNIMGNVNEINSDAKVYDDLSKEEKLIYRENLINEYVDYFKDFYERAGFDEDDIASFIDRALEGDPAGQTLPIAEKKLPKKSGGGVEITPMPRTNFGNGGAAGADENFAAELEYFFTNPDAELPKMQTYKETMNPIEVLNDIIDPRNYAYYADVLARSGVRITEFATRILPATGKLISDLIQKPAFKITGSDKNSYIQDYTDPSPFTIKGTGIFSEFLENITPTSLEKKIGLDKLIETEEQKQKDRGSTVGPKVLADTVGLGAEVTAPIFPGLKVAQKILKPKKVAAAVENRRADLPEVPDLNSIENLELNLASLKSKVQNPDLAVDEVTKVLVTRLLDKKGIQYGANDPVEVYMEIYGDIIIDVKNLAEEIIDGIEQGRNFKSIDKLLEIEGLDNIPIPKDPNRGVPTEDFIEMLEKDLKEKKMLEGFKIKDKAKNAKGGIIK